MAKKIDREFFESRNIPYDAALSEHIPLFGFTDGTLEIETYHLHKLLTTLTRVDRKKEGPHIKTMLSYMSGAEKYLRYLRSKGIATALATVNDATFFRAMEARIPFHELFFDVTIRI